MILPVGSSFGQDKHMQGENMNKKILVLLFLVSTVFFVPVYAGPSEAGKTAAAMTESVGECPDKSYYREPAPCRNNRYWRQRQRMRNREIRRENRQIRRAIRWRWMNRNGRRVRVRY